MADLEITIEKLSKKIDDYIAESRAARAKTDAELKEIRANRKICDKRTDENFASFKRLMRAVLIEVIVMDIAIIAAIILK